MGTTGHCGTGRRAAFFDVDNTLIGGDTQEMEARHLMPRECLFRGRVLTCLRALAAVALHRMGRVPLIRQNEAYTRIYRGKTRRELAALGREVYRRQISHNLLDGAGQILEERRARGDLIVLVTATPLHLAQPLGKIFRPNHLFCTALEFDREGRATGRAAGGILLGEKKAEVIKRFSAGHNLDLSRCRAYSDHHSDLPMLTSVGRPEVINPTAELEAHALASGWPVHRFPG